MILTRFPSVTVLYIVDQYSDVGWSDNLDHQIQMVTGPGQSVILYGSRDSFIKYYSGKYECQEIEQTVFVSGTDIRKKISGSVVSSPLFRKGVIWAVNNQYPKCFPTVDVAIMKSNEYVLLGKKNKEPFYRFVGGFVSPGETYEDAAVREVKEETGLVIDNTLKYLGSYVIDDWRYRSEVDKITSTFFIGIYKTGTPVPGDDINELRWFTLDRKLFSVIVEEHKPMLHALLNNFWR